MDDWEARLEAERLALSSPEVVYDYLSKLPRPTSFWDVPLPDFVIERLIERKDPLVDLAVARFASNSRAMEPLWDRGEMVRLALMGNRNRAFVPADRLKEVLTEATRDQVHALMTNPTLHEFVLSAVFLNEIELDEEVWWNACASGILNERLRTTLKADTFSEQTRAWDHEKPIQGAWDLYIQAPATTRWATALSNAGKIAFVIGLPKRLMPPEGTPKESWQGEYHKRQDAYRELMWKLVREKWVGPEGIEKEDHLSSFRWARRAFAEAYIREHSIGQTSKFADDADPAFRHGFYVAADVTEHWPIDAYHERDGDEFIDSVIWNDSLYLRTNCEIQSKIKRMARASTKDMDHVISALSRRRKVLEDQDPERYGDQPTEEMVDHWRRQDEDAARRERMSAAAAEAAAARAEPKKKGWFGS